MTGLRVIRSVRGTTLPAAPAAKPQATPFGDLSTFVHAVEELKALAKVLDARMEQVGATEDLRKLLTEARDMSSRLEEAFTKLKKGPPGEPGRPGQDAEPVDVEHVIKEVVRRVPPAPPGKDAEPVDLKKVARMAAQHVQIPAPPAPADPDIAPFIEKMVELLREGKVKIKAEHIDGLEQTLEPVRDLVRRHGSIRGGGDTVAAGSNVTLTKLANGQVQINASPGSGFTALTATETPNGNRTVFTFAAATAKPSYIVVDNVWTKDTSAAGTVNWTWNNGTKKATFTVPPNDDIFGIV